MLNFRILALAGALAFAANAALAAELPDLGGRTVHAVTENGYVPLNFADPKTGKGIGWEYDAFNEIAKRLNAKVDWKLSSWDTMIQSVREGQFDVGMDGITINDERKKQVDFVEYFTAGSGILVKKGNPEKVKTIADLCGKKVAIQVGTVQIDEAEEQNGKCGDKKISIQTFEQNTDTIQAVGTGRADAALMDFPVAIYGASKVKGTEVVGEQYDTGNYGIAVRKDDGEVKTGLEAALKAMREKGKYDAILKYWGLEAGALK